MRIFVPGPLEVWRGDEGITPRSAGERTILALLALTPGAFVSAGTLVDQLWRGHPPPGAANVLHTYVSRLRARRWPAAASTSRPARHRPGTN